MEAEIMGQGCQPASPGKVKSCRHNSASKNTLPASTTGGSHGQPRREGDCCRLVAVVYCAAGIGCADRAEIAKAIRQLGDNDYAVHERASKFLWEAGQAAEPALQKALKSDDEEVAVRARTIMGKFKWGIYPDTPEQIVKLIRDYQFGDPGDARRRLSRNCLGWASKAKRP